MTVKKLLRQDYITTGPNISVHSVEDQLIHQGFLVVIEDNGSFVGILKSVDVLEFAHTLVVDCLRDKLKIDVNSDLESVLVKMKKCHFLVLPVFKETTFIGVVTLEDITDYYLFEYRKELEQSEKRFKTIFNYSGDAIIIHDFDGHFIDVNRKLYECLGYSKEELMQLTPTDIETSEYADLVPKRIEDLLQKGSCSFLTGYVRRDRTIIPIELSSRIIELAGKKVVLNIARDITERKKAEAAKTALQTKLMQARKMEAISTLAGGVAHDFNNALTGVIGNIELLKINPSSHNVGSRVQAIEGAALRIADLTKQLLAYARGGKYQVKEINLQEFIEQEIQEIRCSVGRNFEVVSSLDCREIPVMVDSSQLQMLFNAIVTNAIEAMVDHCIIEISCSEQELAEEFIRSHPGSEYGPYVCFSVKDNGCGMDEETLKRIFEPFYSTKFAGRGLGMAAVYGIAKNHGGYISVDSKPDKGTLVEVYLPLLSLRESTAIAKTAEPAAKLTVLLIEDEEMLHTVEKRLLETLGYNVLTAKNGREALQLVKDYQKSVDLVLMDIHLPDITADILYLKLVEACPTMKVLLCSGSAMEWTAQKALNAGAEGFIEKPFSLQKLNDALLKAINMR